MLEKSVLPRPVVDLPHLKIFGEIVSKLSLSTPCDDIRQQVVGDIAKLLDAEFCTSYIWNAKTGRSEMPVSNRMRQEDIATYERRFQFRDPISWRLRSFRRPVLVEQAMPYADLERTEFYNEFLKSQGMRRGINLFLFDGTRDVGDLRIWRAGIARDFGETELQLLGALEPFLRRAFATAARPDRLGLTERERDVVRLVAKGCRDHDIARILGISFGTVRTHINNAMSKQGCANRAELAAIAARSPDATN